MTEPQVRGTDRNEAAERLREWLHPDYRPDLDAALAEERRRIVEQVRQALGEPDTAVGLNEDWLAWGEETVRAILDEIESEHPR